MSPSSPLNNKGHTRISSPVHSDVAVELKCEHKLLTISSPIDGAAVEGHDVLRQGAGFVAEDVFDLSQLFV